MEVNGIAHIFLTASNFERSREFYRKLLPFLGLKPVIDTETTYYCVGGRTAVGISAPSPEYAGVAFEQNRVGLHHLCFRARERADIDELHTFAAKRRAPIGWVLSLMCNTRNRAFDLVAPHIGLNVEGISRR